MNALNLHTYYTFMKKTAYLYHIHIKIYDYTLGRKPFRKGIKLHLITRTWNTSNGDLQTFTRCEHPNRHMHMTTMIKRETKLLMK